MYRLLVVDDSQMMISMYKNVLAKCADCAVVTARNGKEALEVIAQGEPNLIFLDINMPVMDGLECLARLRLKGITPRVPVVMVTTEGKPDDVKRALDGGASEYLRKPFRREDLLAIVARVLGPARERRTGPP
jgi:CheY-like chemotaxis protein